MCSLEKKKRYDDYRDTRNYQYHRGDYESSMHEDNSRYWGRKEYLPEYPPARHDERRHTDHLPKYMPVRQAARRHETYSPEHLPFLPFEERHEDYLPEYLPSRSFKGRHDDYLPEYLPSRAFNGRHENYLPEYLPSRNFDRRHEEYLPEYLPERNFERRHEEYLPEYPPARDSERKPTRISDPTFPCGSNRIWKNAIGSVKNSHDDYYDRYHHRKNKEKGQRSPARKSYHENNISKTEKYDQEKANRYRDCFTRSNKEYLEEQLTPKRRNKKSISLSDTSESSVAYSQFQYGLKLDQQLEIQKEKCSTPLNSKDLRNLYITPSCNNFDSGNLKPTNERCQKPNENDDKLKDNHKMTMLEEKSINKTSENITIDRSLLSVVQIDRDEGKSNEEKICTPKIGEKHVQKNSGNCSLSNGPIKKPSSDTSNDSLFDAYSFRTEDQSIQNANENENSCISALLNISKKKDCNNQSSMGASSVFIDDCKAKNDLQEPKIDEERSNISILQNEDSSDVPSPDFSSLSSDDTAVVFLEESKNVSNQEYNRDVFLKRIKQKRKKKLRKRYQTPPNQKENKEVITIEENNDIVVCDPRLELDLKENAIMKIAELQKRKNPKRIKIREWCNDFHQFVLKNSTKAHQFGFFIKELGPPKSLLIPYENVECYKYLANNNPCVT